MAESQVPRGIAELSELNRVSITQKTSVKNKYRIMAPDGREVLYAKEDSNLLHAMFSGKNRSFEMDIFDTDNVKVITLRRPYTFGPDKMDVRVGPQLACIVRQEVTFLKPVLRINDANDQPYMRIKGPIGKTGDADFCLFDGNKKQIGVIRKKWGGLARELFTDSDAYEIVFPPHLDVRFKAGLIGACMLIDFLYYEH